MGPASIERDRAISTLVLFWLAMRSTPCGWVKDRFGLAWQINPTVLTTLLTAHGPEAAARVLHAVWKMEKLDIKTLERAAAGNDPGASGQDTTR